jgi:cyclophilin family peptidyl-prolyl cis-trans isomerase
MKKLDNKFSIFGYVIEGNYILEQLQSGDRVVDVEVEDGVWELSQPDIFADDKIISTND